MRRTAGWLALPGRTLSAGFYGGLSPSFPFVAAQLLGGWVPTETGLSPASHSRLLWTHSSSALRQEARAGARSVDPLRAHPPASLRSCSPRFAPRPRSPGLGVA